MTNIDLLTLIGAVFTLVPIIFYLLNYNQVGKNSRSIFVYLVISFIVEALYILNYFYFHKSTFSLTLLFLLYELLFLFLFYKKFFNKGLNLILKVILILFGLLVFIELFQIEKVSYEIFLGGSKIIILIICVNAILVSFGNKIPYWSRVATLAFLQYAFLGVVIFSFANFFIENKEYIFYFVLLNSISNIVLYLILTYSMYLCRKKYLQV